MGKKGSKGRIGSKGGEKKKNVHKGKKHQRAKDPPTQRKEYTLKMDAGGEDRNA